MTKGRHDRNPARICLLIAALLVFVACRSFSQVSRATIETIKHESNLGSAPADLTVSSDILYFSADDGVHGRELWQVDSKGEIRLVQDILRGPESANPRKLCPVVNGVYLVGDLPEAAPDDVAVWCHQVGSTNVKFVEAFPKEGEPGWLVSHRDGAVFDMIFANQGREAAYSKKGAPSAALIREIAPGPAHGVSTERVVAHSFEGHALFKARSRRELDWQLWMTDGTPEGTVPILPDEALGANVTYGEPVYATAIGPRLFFSGAATLWVVSRQEDGPFVARPIPGPGAPRSFREFRDLVYFQAEDKEHGAELWRTDGTPAGTFMVKDICPGPPSSSPYALSALGDVLVFNADDGLHGVELWRSDGTDEGTTLVMDLCAGAAGANPYQNTVYNGRLFFAAEHPEYGEELWSTDGTAAGTALVKEIHPGPQDAEPYYLTVYAGLLYFCADDGVHGEELWRTDGTEQGTRLVKDIRPETHRVRSSNPVELAAFEESLYFVADDVAHGAELWTCAANGLRPGPARPVKDICPGSGHSDPQHLTAAPDRLLFAADDGVHGRELWESDGTPIGTRMVADLCVGPEGANPRHFALLGETVCFVATTEPNRDVVFGVAHGAEAPETVIEVNDFAPNGAVAGLGVLENCLFACVRTEEGLLQFLCYEEATKNPRFVCEHRVSMSGAWESLRALSGGLSEKESRELLHAYLLMPGRPRRSYANHGNTLTFAASTTEFGCELWQTDSGIAEAHVLKDCFPGRAGGTPSELTVVDGMLYFAAERPGGTRELWQSDGTEQGTYIVPGAVGSGADEIRAHQQLLFLTVFDPIYRQGTRLLAHEDSMSGLVGIVLPRGRSNERPYNVHDLVAVGDRLFFSASVFDVGQELCTVTHPYESRPDIVNILPEGPYDGTRRVEVRASWQAAPSPEKER